MGAKPAVNEQGCGSSQQGMRANSPRAKGMDALTIYIQNCDHSLTLKGQAMEMKKIGNALQGVRRGDA